MEQVSKCVRPLPPPAIYHSTIAFRQSIAVGVHLTTQKLTTFSVFLVDGFVHGSALRYSQSNLIPTSTQFKILSHFEEISKRSQPNSGHN